VAYGIVLKFDGVTEDQYWGVNDALGLGRDDWSAGWPDGAIAHTGGPTADGGWIVTEVWESKAHQERFMASKLGAALMSAGLPEPAFVIDSDLANYKTSTTKK
jgi:hypothetical protein